MKISCQSCHSKYNVADDKVQGKIVKIRCRKCGATIVVNATAGATINGSPSLPPPASAPAASPATPASTANGGAEWHVSVTDTDQRTMSQAELVSAYRTGVVVQDTFVWTEGMDDWKALSDVEVLAGVLKGIDRKAAEHASAAAAHEAPAAAPIEMAPASAPRAYEPLAASPAAAAQAAAAAPVQEPRRAAVKREARSRDLFATRSGEELVGGLGDGSGDDGRLTGQRNENSVLFSLEHLTKNTEERAHDEPQPKNEDSGIIDLKALAEKAESMRPATAADANPLTAPLGFSAPLGSPMGDFGSAGADRRSKSKLPVLLVVGAAVILLPVLGVVIGLRLGGTTTPASSAASATASQAPSATAVASDTAASASASAAAQASASASSSAPVAATMPKPRPYGSATWHAANGAGAPAAKGPAGGGAPAAGGGGGAPSPAPAGKKNDCNCNGDLMCMMKCSTH